MKSKFKKICTIMFVFAIFFCTISINVYALNPEVSFPNFIPKYRKEDAYFYSRLRNDPLARSKEPITPDLRNWIDLYIHMPSNDGESWAQGDVYLYKNNGSLVGKTSVGNYSGDLCRVLWKDLDPNYKYYFVYNIYKSGKEQTFVYCIYDVQFSRES